MLGVGEGLIHGAPLKNALTFAAATTGTGAVNPPEAQRLISKPFIAAWMYRLIGGIGLRLEAKRWGAHKNLKRKPLSG